MRVRAAVGTRDLRDAARAVRGCRAVRAFAARTRFAAGGSHLSSSQRCSMSLRWSTSRTRSRKRLSLVLLFVAAGCWVHVYAGGSRSWLAVAAGSLAVGAAVVVRPSNVFALPVWIVALAALAWFRVGMRDTGVVAARGGRPRGRVADAPAARQQRAPLRTRGHRWSPRASVAISRSGASRILKYATALAPIPLPSVFYMNPFAGRPSGRRGAPLAWYVEHPGGRRGHARPACVRHARPGSAVHVRPRSRSLVSATARHRDARRDRAGGSGLRACLRAARGAIATIASYSLRCQRSAPATSRLHATTAVEMRFGLPLLVVAVSARRVVRSRGLAASFAGRRVR